MRHYETLVEDSHGWNWIKLAEESAASSVSVGPKPRIKPLICQKDKLGCVVVIAPPPIKC
jgi:hypothetical protein